MTTTDMVSEIVDHMWSAYDFCGSFGKRDACSLMDEYRYSGDKAVAYDAASRTFGRELASLKAKLQISS